MQLAMLEAHDGREWRSWLRKHHTLSPGVWLVFHKDRTGVESIPYEEAVKQALCYGWIDSLIKKLDEKRYARKFTPRQPTSKWSDTNRKRWAELRDLGLLESAGLAAAPTDRSYAPRPKIPDLPGYIAAAFKTDPQAWRFFRSLSSTDRRQFVTWIHTAKRPETRERRIRESIQLLAAGRKLGLR